MSVLPMPWTMATAKHEEANWTTDTMDGNGISCITILLISSMVAEHAEYAATDWITSRRFGAGGALRSS